MSYIVKKLTDVVPTDNEMDQEEYIQFLVGEKEDAERNGNAELARIYGALIIKHKGVLAQRRAEV